jgi:hypothetical protein
MDRRHYFLLFKAKNQNKQRKEFDLSCTKSWVARTAIEALVNRKQKPRKKLEEMASDCEGPISSNHSEFTLLHDSA